MTVRYIIGDDDPKPLNVYLEHDGNDVNIVVGDYIIAALRPDGKLLIASSVAGHLGLAVNEHGEIEIVREA